MKISCPMSMEHAILHSQDTLASHSLTSSCSPHLRLYVPEGWGLYPLPSRRGKERWGNLSDCLKGGNGEISSECAYRKTCITLMSDFGKVASLHNGGSTYRSTLLSEGGLTALIGEGTEDRKRRSKACSEAQQPVYIITLREKDLLCLWVEVT